MAKAPRCGRRLSSTGEPPPTPRLWAGGCRVFVRPDWGWPVQRLRPSSPPPPLSSLLPSPFPFPFPPSLLPSVPGIYLRNCPVLNVSSFLGLCGALAQEGREGQGDIFVLEESGGGSGPSVGEGSQDGPCWVRRAGGRLQAEGTSEGAQAPDWEHGSPQASRRQRLAGGAQTSWDNSLFWEVEARSQARMPLVLLRESWCSWGSFQGPEPTLLTLEVDL